MSKSTSTKMADSGTKDNLNDDDIFKLADLYFKTRENNVFSSTLFF